MFYSSVLFEVKTLKESKNYAEKNYIFVCYLLFDSTC